MFNFKRWFIMARKIDKIIIHCAATPEGRDVKMETIKSWHVKGNGWSDIGYHYVIELDGSVKAGRPLHRSGAHTKGHNATSIGICYVGGMDKDKKPKDTRTEAQRKAMDQLVDDLKMEHPTASVHGHNEFAAKACPSFDVSKEYGAPKVKKAKSKASE
jgi:N-acetylmuramoyl-L-alanine amidase